MNKFWLLLLLAGNAIGGPASLETGEDLLKLCEADKAVALNDYTTGQLIRFGMCVNYVQGFIGGYSIASGPDSPICIPERGTSPQEIIVSARIVAKRKPELPKLRTDLFLYFVLAEIYPCKSH